MLKVKKIMAFMARNRARRNMEFDPSLKEYSKNFQVEEQIKNMRKLYNENVDETLSEALKEENPKLKQRFYIQQQKLDKKIKKVYKNQMDVKKINPELSDPMKFVSDQKSHLYDQKEQIQFDKKFRQQLFKMKETKRLVEKKRLSMDTYLEHEQDDKFLQYEKNKNELKNNRIQSMLNFNKNNEQLQKLIESGLINNPENLKLIMQQVKSYPQLPSRETKQISIKNESENNYQFIDKLQDIGPEQLKDQDKIKDFLKTYNEMNEMDKKKSQQNLSLLHQIKVYENQLFLQRYDAINFRFKGRVGFNFFHEKELIDYIKHHIIDPQELLLIYQQNKKQISKFNLPIITPPVMANIYSKTSLYKFPQTNTNNRINMLNDKLFINLQKETFKNIDKLNNQDFCSCVYAYAKNHQDEQGILKKKLSNKINQVVFDQVEYRIHSLTQEDFGFLMRGLERMPLMKYSSAKWQNVINIIGLKLPQMNNSYAIESTFRFLTALPQCSLTIEIIEKNLNLFGKYDWENNFTLSSFLFSSALLIRYSKHFSDGLKKIKQILKRQEGNLEKIIPDYPINFIPQFLTVFRESHAHLEMQKLSNLVKKSTHDNINKQKQIIKDKNVVLLLYNFALIDYQKHVSNTMSKIKASSIYKQTENMIRKSCLKMLTPIRAIPYNSPSYFIYHNLAKLSHSQMHNLSAFQISKIMEALSLIHYKNQSIYDQFTHKILDKIDDYDQTKEKQLSQYDLKQPNSRLEKVKCLVSIINSFCHQRRSNDLFKEASQKIINEYFGQIKLMPKNQVIKMMGSMVSLIPSSELSSIKNFFRKIIKNIIFPLVKTNIFLEEELISLLNTSVICEVDLDIILQLCEIMPKQFKNIQSHFIHAFTLTLINPSKENQNNFSKIEKKYKSIIEKEIERNESDIGCPYSNQIVYNKFYEELVKEEGKENVVKRGWSIEIISRKKVYFVGTYDHIYSTREVNRERVNVQLFGYWKLYELYYKNWEFHLICSFLEK